MQEENRQAEFDLVLRGGRVVTPDGVAQLDVGVSQGRIAALSPNVGLGQTEADATGLWVMPGGVDPHCHIEQMSGMGVMNADTFETATRSALLGGTTSVISFAAQRAGQPLRDAVFAYAVRAGQGAMVDYAFHLSVSDTGVAGFDDDLSALIREGHRSVKIFTTYNIRLDDRDILSLMIAARQHGALICVHAENHGMIEWARDALLAAGLSAPKYHAVAHPRLAEVEAISRMITFAEFTGAAVMLFHISTREAADLIAHARTRGVSVLAETCPHYLMMTSDVLNKDGVEGAKFMCSPPQRDHDDQIALWDALTDGALDLISSDHAPYRMDETGKLSAGENADFSQIANGLPGLQTRLPLLFDHMVVQGHGGAMKFAQLTAQRAAEIYGLDTKGRIAIGADADLVLWDDRQTTTYGADDLADNAGYNPWHGRVVQGAVRDVFLRGKHVVRSGQLKARKGQGKWLKRGAIGAQPTTPAAEVRLVEN
jgi:dihydropyrimidinase